jgi:hypothetical protein
MKMTKLSLFQAFEFVKMGIGGHHFVAAATILHRFYDSPTVSLVRTPMQGYSSSTYIATFADGNSIVLQFRPQDRAIDEECIKTARKQIGDLAPRSQTVNQTRGFTPRLRVVENTRIIILSLQQNR